MPLNIIMLFSYLLTSVPGYNQYKTLRIEQMSIYYRSIKLNPIVIFTRLRTWLTQMLSLALLLDSRAL